MSRLEELNNGLDNIEKSNGMAYPKWMVFLLSDIAKSLAVIADKMTDDNEQKEVEE